MCGAYDGGVDAAGLRLPTHRDEVEKPPFMILAVCVLGKKNGSREQFCKCCQLMFKTIPAHFYLI